jgi:polyisoprenoid-binding protein YceI
MNTKLLSASFAIAMLPFTLAIADTTHFTPAKAASVKAESTRVTIKGTSTLHEWTMEGTTINGTVDTDPNVWRAAGEKPANVSVTIPVASIKSDHAKMDDLMRDALKSKANPTIRYEMATGGLTKSTGDSFIVRTNGKLSIAGTTRDVTMDVTATRLGDGRYLLAGELPIHMKDYGVKPPTAMLGTIKAGPDVTIAFRWVVGRV